MDPRVERMGHELDLPPELLASAPEPLPLDGIWEAVAAELAQTCQRIVDEFGPGLLAGAGLDPARYRLVYETSPFDLRLRPHPKDSP